MQSSPDNFVSGFTSFQYPNQLTSNLMHMNTIGQLYLYEKGQEILKQRTCVSLYFVIRNVNVSIFLNCTLSTRLDTLHFRQQEKDWINWRARSLEEDIGYCHPESTGEWKYLTKEVKSIRNHSTCFNNSDGWFYFDWLALLLVITTIITYIVFLKTDGIIAYKIHRCVLIMLLLVLWIRIAKYARPFQSTGPIVVIFFHIMKDIIKCSFLFAMLFIPYLCAFWLTFGPYSPGPVTGYNNFGALFHSLLCMVVGVDFPFEDLLSEDPFMARLLCSSFIISTAIIVVNLLIALLSDTFTRLYSNAVANAVMQRAQSILQMEKTMCKKRRQDYYKFVRENCSPQVVLADFRSSSQPKTEKENAMDKMLNEIKTLKTTVQSLQEQWYILHVFSCFNF